MVKMMRFSFQWAPLALLALCHNLSGNDAFSTGVHRCSISQQNRCRRFDRNSLKVASSQSAEQAIPDPTSPFLKAIDSKRVLVVGGSGRVGGSVVKQLLKNEARVTVGGRNEQRWNEAWSRYQQLWATDLQQLPSQVTDISFASLDCSRADSVSAVLRQGLFDLVVHTAGPFQGKADTPNGVLEACVASNIPYVDVCDDYCTACGAKSKFSAKARDASVPCIISTGCWPGVSSLMAKQLIHNLLRKEPSLKADDLKIDFSFFTAGSGGAGVTLLVATFLILAEKALTIVNGRRRGVQAMKEYTTVNFGPVVGDRDVAHLNLLETASIHDVFGIPNITTRFGTAPQFWNTLLGLMAQLPPSILSNEDLMTKLAVFSLPIVRLVDYFAGATNSMRCDVATTSTSTPSLRATAIYAHENLETCVGECVVPFCGAVLAGKVRPGVWFPEEAIEAGGDATQVLRLASNGAHTIQVLGDVMCEDVWGKVEPNPVPSLVV